jgi:hypothetical protein
MEKVVEIRERSIHANKVRSFYMSCNLVWGFLAASIKKVDYIFQFPHTIENNFSAFVI